MKHKTLYISILLLSFSLSMGAQAKYRQVDSLLHCCDTEGYALGVQILESELPALSSKHDRYNTLWRLGYFYYLQGDTSSDKAYKLEKFNKSMEYTLEAIDLDPEPPDARMWYCGCIGRWAMVCGLSEMLSSVGKIYEQLHLIIETYHHETYAPAWQTYAEIFRNHPFKPTSGAIAYTRAAIHCKNPGELRFDQYLLLAEMLIKRDWSASKRASNLKTAIEMYNNFDGGLCDRYEFFEGKLGASYLIPWTGKPIGENSDSEELRCLESYVKNKYASASSLSAEDRMNYQKFLKLLEK